MGNSIPALQVMDLLPNQRTRPVPSTIRAAVAAHVRHWGVSGAARALGVSRGVVLAILAETGVMPGTLALVRESLARRADQEDAA